MFFLLDLRAIWTYFLAHMKLHQFNSISELLNAELKRRQDGNNSYSLRAFSRDLKINVGSLSSVINNKAGLSGDSLKKVAKVLAKNKLEREFLNDLALSEYSRNEGVKSQASERLVRHKKLLQFKRLQREKFQVVSKWYHCAIIELIQLENFKPDSEWIARQLGISNKEASEALKTLKSLEMIKVAPSGKIVASPDAYSIFSDVPSRAVRAFHGTVLQKHIHSLWKDDMEDREHLSMFLAIPSSKLDDFKKKMREFCMEFWEDLDSKEPKDELYSLSLQFCPTTRNQKQKGECSRDH